MHAFLAQSGWGAAEVFLLAGDASNRRYFRLYHGQKHQKAVVMDAPASRGEDVRPFIKIAQYLTGLGLSAPRILAQDTKQGFLLLEDLGDALFARIVANDPSLEDTLYTAATDVLVELHQHAPPPDLPHYDPATATQLSALVFDWYAPDHSKERQGYLNELQSCLETHAPDCTVLVQRDYHAENLLWLPDRLGLAKVGLLDFQDAALGHPAYDLVSLLQDARRDVPEQVEAQMVRYYAAKTGHDLHTFQTAYAVLGAQRNLRILGIFARLGLRDGKPHYIDLMPRVWGLLMRDLSHPALAQLKSLTDALLEAPTPAVTSSLKARCA